MSTTAAARAVLVQSIASTEERIARSLRMNHDASRPVIVRGQAHLQSLRAQLARMDTREGWKS